MLFTLHKLYQKKLLMKPWFSWRQFMARPQNVIVKIEKFLEEMENKNALSFRALRLLKINDAQGTRLRNGN